MAKRLVAANSRRLAALALLAGLCACATTSTEPRPEAQPAGWRIVERIGEARYAPPGAAWVAAAVGETLAGGSEVATGRGGRLIVGAPGRHISVGPDSRFVLPDRERGDRLEQRAGWLRYRIAEAEAQPFRINTRSLELELLAGVVDVHVNHLATEVTVKEGQVRVATPDGLRQTQMMAGQSARAGFSDDVRLALSAAPGAPLQAVEPVIVPALQPKAAPADTPKVNAPPVPSAARLRPVPSSDALAEPPGDRTAREAWLTLDRAPAINAARSSPAAAPGQGAAVSAIGRREAPTQGTPGRQPQLVERRPAESDAAAIRRGKFERLTAGMLDQVEPAGQHLIRR